jgi:hypothetical protein
MEPQAIGSVVHFARKAQLLIASIIRPCPPDS